MKHLMRCQSENSVFKFLWRKVDGGGGGGLVLPSEEMKRE